MPLPVKGLVNVPLRRQRHTVSHGVVVQHCRRCDDFDAPLRSVLQRTTRLVDAPKVRLLDAERILDFEARSGVNTVVVHLSRCDGIAYWCHKPWALRIATVTQQHKVAKNCVGGMENAQRLDLFNEAAFGIKKVASFSGTHSTRYRNGCRCSYYCCSCCCSSSKLTTSRG